MIDETRLAEIVREAGRIACSLWPGAGHRLHSWEKAPGDPVSDADLAVDRFLKRELNALLPAAAWLSEETWTIRRGLRAIASGWSIPSMEPAISSADGRAGPYPWHWYGQGGR
jgi:myo-inositol-1(or 4)-monophosphatase